eukprot:118700-Rhodomonas_salina.1
MTNVKAMTNCQDYFLAWMGSTAPCEPYAVVKNQVKRPPLLTFDRRGSNCARRKEMLLSGREAARQQLERACRLDFAVS